MLVFTRTKHGANKLAEYLTKQDIASAAIHGNKSQAARTRALEQFKTGKLPVLVATDIAARGLDIDQLPQVVNFELPNVPEDYVPPHRPYRPRRQHRRRDFAGGQREEIKLLSAIERVIKRKIDRATAEGFVPSANPQHDDERREPRPGRSAPRREGGQGRPGPRSEARTGKPANGRRLPAQGRAPMQPMPMAAANPPPQWW